MFVVLASTMFYLYKTDTPRSADPTQNQVAIYIEGEKRIVESNGIPDHMTGLFPNANDPFGIRAQSHRYQMPSSPQPNVNYSVMGVREFGVALNGVPFDPAGPFYKGDQTSGWEFEPLKSAIGAHLGVDTNNAHTQPNGAYHYHGLPIALYQRLLTQVGDESKHMILVGWAADGFPIYGRYGHSNPKDSTSPLRAMRSSYRLKQGNRPPAPGGQYNGDFIQDYEYAAGLGDLDECNGRFGVTPEFPQGIYHYYLTDEFPVIPRNFRGTPDDSFLHPGGGPGLGEVPPGLRNYPHVQPPRP
jgi:hypothetical protein